MIVDDLKLFTPYSCKQNNKYNSGVVYIMLFPERIMIKFMIYSNTVIAGNYIYRKVGADTLGDGFSTYSDFYGDLRPLFDRIFQ